VNLCLANKFRTIYSRAMKDALFRPGNLSLSAQMEGEDLRTVDDEYCQSRSAYLQRTANASEKQAWDRTFLGEFVDFVGREDPKVLSTIEAIFTTGTHADAADWLGITEGEFGRMRTRLGQLAKCFLSGEPVPRQRRPYKKRVVKTKEFAGSRLAA
jgi:hypothetical protein